MAEKIHIEGREISIKSVNDQDYISLTDMSGWDKDPNSRQRIANWLKNRSTIQFLQLWENKHNKDFNYIHSDVIKNEVAENSYLISAKKWIEQTGAIGILSKAGRYGGTFAHRDIAFEFATWLSPIFKFNLITEFQRLRSEEFQRKQIQWDAGRELARLNYPIQTESIKKVSGSLKDEERRGLYAKEADRINRIVFGMTAKQWRAKHPDEKGNIRDSASTAENVIVANLTSLNSWLMDNGAREEARDRALAEMAGKHFEILNQKYLPE